MQVKNEKEFENGPRLKRYEVVSWRLNAFRIDDFFSSLIFSFFKNLVRSYFRSLLSRSARAMALKKQENKISKNIMRVTIYCTWSFSSCEDWHAWLLYGFLCFDTLIPLTFSISFIYYVGITTSSSTIVVAHDWIIHKITDIETMQNQQKREKWHI